MWCFPVGAAFVLKARARVVGDKPDAPINVPVPGPGATPVELMGLTVE